MTGLLFVYGTLLSGVDQPIGCRVRKADFVGAAAFQGCLYRVARYPGVVSTSAQPAPLRTADVRSMPGSTSTLARSDRSPGGRRTPAGPEREPPGRERVHATLSL